MFALLLLVLISKANLVLAADLSVKNCVHKIENLEIFTYDGILGSPDINDDVEFVMFIQTVTKLHKSVGEILSAENNGHKNQLDIHGLPANKISFGQVIKNVMLESQSLFFLFKEKYSDIEDQQSILEKATVFDRNFAAIDELKHKKMVYFYFISEVQYDMDRLARYRNGDQLIASESLEIPLDIFRKRRDDEYVAPERSHTDPTKLH